MRWLVIGVLVLVAGCRSRCTSATARDLVLIVVDTLRADHVSLYGYPRATTPALEAFARDAVVYEHAISPATWTVPAHASLFTGRWPSFAGAERVPAEGRHLATPIRPDVPTLAELVGAHGFRTAAFIGNTVYVAEILGFGRGFAELIDLGFKPAAELRSAVARWLPRQRGRLFLFMNIVDPHEPYEPPPPFAARFPGRRQEYGTMMSVFANAGAEITPTMRDHFVSQYDGEVAFADEAIGRIFEDLKASGRYDEAMIVVTSDHGELLGEHGTVGHATTPYEEVVHVPLIVKHPCSVRAGERVARRVSTLGVFATMLQGVRVPYPAEMQARPLDEPSPVWVEDIDNDAGRVRVGYDGPLKLVSISSPAWTATWLYDLALDPAELRPIQDGTRGAALHAALSAFAAVPRPVNPAAAPVVDPERERQLRALGYVR